MSESYACLAWLKLHVVTPLLVVILCTCTHKIHPVQHVHERPNVSSGGRTVSVRMLNKVVIFASYVHHNLHACRTRLETKSVLIGHGQLLKSRRWLGPDSSCNLGVLGICGRFKMMLGKKRWKFIMILREKRMLKQWD